MLPADTEAVAALEQQIFSQPWSSQGFLDALSGDNVIFLVAEAGEPRECAETGKAVEEKQIIGYCGIYCALDEGEITNVAVDEACRNSGVGRKLVSRLLQEAKANGIRTVVLEVRTSNAGAIHLYESLGFSVCGIRKGFYEKPKEDGYVMTLSQ